ncbi:sodium:proton antiporter [Actinomycetes bacterium]|nr:sodium:proton antiporter [Actinomycetes bacterium]
MDAEFSGHPCCSGSFGGLGSHSLTAMYLALVSSVDQLDFGRILLDLAIVLVVAKVAAELAERIRVPAVLGEIIAGLALGPSVLGLVNPSDALKVLAELGVIVLLVQVGLEMDLVELRRVGRASLGVAVIGVVLPMGAGVVAGYALGETMTASLFLGAALAATSVGITARVFEDLHALSSAEARIVLGAAVADDVLGLIILTVVTRIAKDGSIDIASVLGTVALAVAFLTVSGIVGMFVIPRLFGAIGSRAASPATIGVLAGAAAFGFAAAADAANLAPIIGAFMAGIALGKVPQRDRVAREFSVLGNLLIPIFFLQIGIDTDVAKFFQTHVLWVATILTVIAIASKMLASIGAVGTIADKLIIGIGMVPRGEVGIIFAAIGLQIGVFDDDLYVVVLLVVLITTVITPPLLRWRLDSATTVPLVLPTETDEPQV